MSVCKNCKYYNSCGDPTREMVCDGYEAKTDIVEIDSKEVFQYFTDLITDKETWNGDEEQNKTMHSFIGGALTFCTTFGILTDDEKLELECLEIPTESEEEHEFTCEDCPYHYYDEGEDYPSCHHTSDDLTAPCEYEPEENSYEEEPWGYEDRNYNRIYNDED